MHPQFLVWCLTFGAQFNIDGRDCCQTGQFSQDVADGALTYQYGSDEPLTNVLGLTFYMCKTNLGDSLPRLVL